MIYLIVFNFRSDTKGMGNFVEKAYQADERTLPRLADADKIRKLHGDFIKITRERDPGVFLAFLHIQFLQLKAASIKRADVEEEYFQAFFLQTKFRLETTSLTNSIRTLFRTLAANELMICLSHFYEEGINKKDRSNLGSFYTPISYCRAALRNIQKGARQEILYDPFCGGGAWLFAHLISGQQTLFAPHPLGYFQLGLPCLERTHFKDFKCGIWQTHDRDHSSHRRTIHLWFSIY